MNFKSDFSLRLYLYFKSWNTLNYDDGNIDQNMRYMTDQQLYQLFNLPEDAYHTKLGKFKRTEFEKRTIEVACKEITEKTGIQCQVAKKNYGTRSRVLNYVFEWVDWKNQRRGGTFAYEDEAPFKDEKGSTEHQTSIYDFEVK